MPVHDGDKKKINNASLPDESLMLGAPQAIAAPIAAINRILVVIQHWHKRSSGHSAMTTMATIQKS